MYFSIHTPNRAKNNSPGKQIMETTTQPEEKVYRKEGFNLHYYLSGQPDQELIVFLHPAFGDHHCFATQVAFFAQDFHVMTVDMPGHGQSQPNGKPVTVDLTSEFIAEISALEGHDQFHIVGVSMGSLIAQDVAVRFPERVKSLTVVGGYSIFGDNKAIQQAQSTEMIKWFFMVIFSMKRFRRYLARTTVIKPDSQAAFYQSATHFTRGSFRVMPGMGKVLRSEDRTHDHPLLILAGDHDLPLVQDFAQTWHQKEPHSVCATIPDAGHCANMDNPDTFNETLLAFLQENR
jgi:pimeloyl-ACP methyl ester carboxylesterase